MKRFLMLLAVATVAGAMYVAAAPGGALHAGPTARQFSTLKRQVAVLQRKVKSVTQEVNGLGGFVLVCMAHQPVSVDQIGDPTNGTGYVYQQSVGNTAPATALDLAPTGGAAPQYRVFVANQSNSACTSIINQASTPQNLSAFKATTGR